MPQLDEPSPDPAPAPAPAVDMSGAPPIKIEGQASQGFLDQVARLSIPEPPSDVDDKADTAHLGLTSGTNAPPQPLGDAAAPGGLPAQPADNTFAPHPHVGGVNVTRSFLNTVQSQNREVLSTLNRVGAENQALRDELRQTTRNAHDELAKQQEIHDAATTRLGMYAAGLDSDLRQTNERVGNQITYLSRTHAQREADLQRQMRFKDKLADQREGQLLDQLETKDRSATAMAKNFRLEHAREMGRQEDSMKQKMADIINHYEYDIHRNKKEFEAALAGLDSENQAKLNESKKQLLAAQADAKLLKNKLEGEIGRLNKQLQDSSLDATWDQAERKQLEAAKKLLQDQLKDARDQIGQLQAAKKTFKQPTLTAKTTSESRKVAPKTKAAPTTVKPKDGIDTQLRDRVRRLEERRSAPAPRQAAGPTYIGGGGAAGGAAGGSGAGGAGGSSSGPAGGARTSDLLAKALQQLAAQKKAKPAQKPALKKKASSTAKKAFAALKKAKTAELNAKKKAALKDAEAKIKQLPKKQQPAARKKAKAAIKAQFDAKKKQIPKSTKGMGLPELSTAIKRLKVLKV